ncbi:ABC-type Fe3+-hydroxamate transport system substrate-binding protein [Bradyrhizobium sp. AZCC 2230]
MAAVADVPAAKQPKRPNVFVERIGGYSQNCCLSFGAENFGKYVELAGGHNTGSDIIPSTFGQISPEQVIDSERRILLLPLEERADVVEAAGDLVKRGWPE